MSILKPKINGIYYEKRKKITYWKPNEY